MKNVMSVRLDRDQLEKIRELAKRDRKEASAVARELIEYGWLYLMLREYRENRLSLGSLARRLGVALSEAIDLLADLGVRSPIEYDDYLKGYEATAGVYRRGRRSR